MATVLLIEDNEMLKVMIMRWLKRSGYEVLYAPDGAQGLDMARAERPDLVLTDMNIPLLDGWTIARTLKGSEDTSAIPIIGLSADALAGDQDKALEAGCDAYYTKPVDFPALLDHIGKMLAK